MIATDGVHGLDARMWIAMGMVLSIALAIGCSTHAKRVALPRTLFYEGQMSACRDKLEKLAKSSRHDRDVVNLDLAVVDLLDGQPKAAEARLRDVRDRFDYLEQDSLTEKTVSMWTDDQVRSYAGEDYEKILVRVFLALSNMMHDGGDAESYTLQIQDKHQQLAERLSGTHAEGASNEYAPLPIGFYLRGLLREATHRDYDDAVRNYELAAKLLPGNRPLMWDIMRAHDGVHSRPGHGVVYVFAMVGRGPYKIEVAEQPTSDAMLIADRIISAVGPYQLPPTIAPIKVPDIAIPPTDTDSVGIAIDGNRIGPTESIANVEQLAINTYRAHHNSIVARAVARRVIKKATVVAAKDTMGTNSLTSLGMDIAGVAWEATEAADTRCWGLLPRDIQVLRVEAPMGTHAISMTPLYSNQPIGAAKQVRVNVIDGRNTYVMCWFPDARSAAHVLTSDSR